MKEIKAFIHRNRAADVVRALRGAGYTNLSVVDVKGMLAALDEQERNYSIELGAEMCKELMDGGIKGLHLYTLNLEKVTLGILEKLGMMK